MERQGQINHKATAITVPERMSQMSQHGVQTGENMISSNTSNNNYSRADLLRVAQTSHKTNFYEDEYKNMVSRMDTRGMSVKNGKSVDPYGELLQLSVLVDEGYRGRNLRHVDSLPASAPPTSKSKSRVSIHRLFRWKRYQDEKHELFMSMMQKLEVKDIERFQEILLVRKLRKMNYERCGFDEDFRLGSTPEQPEGDFRMSTSEGDSSMDSIPDGDFMRSSAPVDDLRMVGTQDENFRKAFAKSTVRPSKENRMNITKQQDYGNATKIAKASVCRHFTKGWCRQGNACSFQHIVEGSRPDTQKVFLGGLPHSVTPAILLRELRQQGYMVVNEPTIFRGFSPQVCLSSTEEAMKMLQQGEIMISGCTIDVRPYQATTKKVRDRELDTNNRSIFLGGLPSSVTLQILRAEMEKRGMKMTNRPLIKAGFIPKLTLSSRQQAHELVAKGAININGAAVSVRPYVSKNMLS